MTAPQPHRRQIEVANDTTRRRFLGISAGIGAALALNGCGDDALTRRPEASDLTVEDAFGKQVTLPGDPQRIVAADPTTMGNMLALGVIPVGGWYDSVDLAPHLAEYLPDGIDNVAVNEELDFEKLLSLRPDLVVTWGTYQGTPYRRKECQRMADAVPTYCYDFDEVYEEGLTGNVLELGKGLGMEEEAQTVVDRWDARVTELRTKVEEVGFDEHPVSVVRVEGPNSYSIRIGSTESIVFRALGIPQPEGQRDPTKWEIEIGAEQLGMLNESWALVVYNLSDLTQEAIESNEVWNALTPVREGRVAFVAPEPWYSSDIVGAMTILDDVETKLLPLAEGP